MWTNCPMKPTDYQPTSDDKARTDELRRQRIKQSTADHAKSATASVAQGMKESESYPHQTQFSEGRASQVNGSSKPKTKGGGKAKGLVTHPDV